VIAVIGNAKPLKHGGTEVAEEEGSGDGSAGDRKEQSQELKAKSQKLSQKFGLDGESSALQEVAWGANS
jgi:hypothetical protein